MRDFAQKVKAVAVLGCHHRQWGSTMRRREFIALLGGATAASAVRPTATGAQTPPKIPRVGFIAGASATGSFVGAFRKGLRELGYVEGQTIALEVRYARGGWSGYPSWWLSLSVSKWMSWWRAAAWQRWRPTRLPEPPPSLWSRLIPSGSAWWRAWRGPEET